MKGINELLKNFKEKFREDKNKRIENHANELYQITEYKGELWLTFNSSLVAPFSLLLGKDYTDKCVTLVNNMRSVFIENHRK